MLAKKRAISECDRWSAFIDPAAGRKKNNHIAHCHFLRRVIDQHEQKDEISMSNGKHRIAHAGNYGGQYERRQNFGCLLANSATDSCSCAPKFANKHGFKGA